MNVELHAKIYILSKTYTIVSKNAKMFCRFPNDKPISRTAQH